MNCYDCKDFGRGRADGVCKHYIDDSCPYGYHDEDSVGFDFVKEDFIMKKDWGFPTLREIKKDYDELMKIIKNVRTVEQAKVLEKERKLIIEINGLSLDEFENGIRLLRNKKDEHRGIDGEIEWIRYEGFGCLSYIYDRFDNKPMFDVWSDYCCYDFITDITIDDLTEEFYEKAKSKAIKTIKGIGGI